MCGEEFVFSSKKTNKKKMYRIGYKHDDGGGDKDFTICQHDANSAWILMVVLFHCVE